MGAFHPLRHFFADEFAKFKLLSSCVNFRQNSTALCTRYDGLVEIERSGLSQTRHKQTLIARFKAAFSVAIKGIAFKPVKKNKIVYRRSFRSRDQFETSRWAKDLNIGIAYLLLIRRGRSGDRAKFIPEVCKTFELKSGWIIKNSESIPTLAYLVLDCVLAFSDIVVVRWWSLALKKETFFIEALKMIHKQSTYHRQKKSDRQRQQKIAPTSSLQSTTMCDVKISGKNFHRD